MPVSPGPFLPEGKGRKSTRSNTAPGRQSAAPGAILAPMSPTSYKPSRGHPLIIGLTGGVGSGKSTAAERFASHGVPVIDTDIIAREVVEPGQPALQRIVEHFGPGMLDGQGRLDRAALRERVFRDESERRFLEELLHPLIRAASLRRIGEQVALYVIWVIPLLLETGAAGDVDRVLLIDCPEWQQIQRVRDRDRLAEEEITHIMAAQASRRERQAVADDIILNDGDLGHLYQAVDARHAAYTALATRP